MSSGDPSVSAGVARANRAEVRPPSRCRSCCFRRPPDRIPWALAAQPYWLGVATNVCVLSLGSLGVWVMFAIGRVDIAQGAFAMLGGYATAILLARVGLSFWLCLPFRLPFARRLGALIGCAILPLRGVYFAMITLSLGEAMRLAVLNGGAATNGARGFVDLPRASRPREPDGFLSLVGGAPAVGLLRGLANRERAGSATCFARCDRARIWPSSLGVDITRYRIIAFAFACGFGGAAARSFAQFQQNIFPGDLFHGRLDQFHAVLFPRRARLCARARWSAQGS